MSQNPCLHGTLRLSQQPEKSQSNFRKTLRDIKKRVCYHKTVTTEIATGDILKTLDYKKGRYMKNVTKEDIYASSITGAYDAAMKKLLSNKEILVPILQMTIPEYEGYTQEEILSCLDTDSITGEDFVSDISGDLRLHKEESELSSITEKLIRFDIRFKARNPKLSTEKLKVSLHIDLEAQRSYRPKNPSYPVVKRAVYYVARDLSSQLGSITGTTDYSRLEKCYSIWICTEDVPKALQNTMTEYALRKNDILGKTAEPEKDYDLMTVILIRQGETPDTQEGIFDYLGRLLRGDIKRAEKYTKIQWSETMKGDVKTMTGFGEAIYQRGIRCGEERGRRLGEETGLRHGELKKARETALSMAEDGMEIERIARLLKVSEDDVRNWTEENRLLVK